MAAHWIDFAPNLSGASAPMTLVLSSPLDGINCQLDLALALALTLALGAALTIRLASLHELSKLHASSIQADELGASRHSILHLIRNPKQNGNANSIVPAAVENLDRMTWTLGVP
jgi:hypothetical protein